MDSNDNLIPVRRAMLSVYHEIRHICEAHNLRFYAAYGTALGAIRHSGFIPWDDDFDIEMLRNDYEKFLETARTELPDWLRLVTWQDTYGYSNLFAKVIISDVNRVAAVEKECGYRLGQGIFVDIFVVDGLPKTKMGQYWQLIRRGILKLRERGLPSFGVLYPRLKSTKDFCSAHTKIINENTVDSCNIAHELGWITLLKKAIKTQIPFGKDVYGEPRWVKFEDTEVPVHAKVEKHLEYEFGDYMKLPPEDQRHPSHGNGDYELPWRFGRISVKRQPLISIVIANYNYGRYLEAAIKSVVDQCWGTAWGPDGQNVLALPNGECVELIICDAKSKDNSLDIIQKHRNELAWWCSEPDGGQSAAFNKGFSHATGKYLTWLNADDLMLDGSLLKITKAMRRNPECQWFTGNYFRFTPNGKIQQMNWGPNFYPKWLQWKNSPIVVFGPTSFFTKKIFNEAGGFLEQLQNGMDNYLWIKFILAGIKQRRIRALCWAFRLHEESKTSDFEGHVRAQSHLDDADRDHLILRELRPTHDVKSSIALFCVRAWRILDGSFVYRWCLSVKHKRVTSLIKNIDGLVRRQFAVVHCMPTPYRNHLFTEMRRQLLAQNVDIWVHFMTQGLGGRPKDWSRRNINFPHKFWRDFGFGTHFFNPGLILHLLFNRPDWLLIGSPYDTFTGMLVALICKARCAKIVWCEGNTKNPGQLGGFKGWLKRWVYSKCQFAAVPGSEGAGFVALHQSHTARKMPRPIMLPNLIDERKFKPRTEWSEVEMAEMRGRLDVDANMRLCLIPARLVPVKGLEQLIEQLDQDMLRGWKVVIVGDGPLRGKLQEMIDSRNLGNHVLLVKNVAYDDMPKIYASADLFMLPSVQDMNPLTVIEALHAGLPMAVSVQAGNVPEAVTEGQNGWILPVKDSLKYKATLNNIFATEIGRLKEMGLKSKEINSKFWDTERSVGNFLKTLGAI